jgi:hypothetical protein
VLFITLPPIKALIAKATDISAAGPLGQRFGELPSFPITG